eukprot:scaffold31046_cov157-Amphora_coffeaeformis.AAC.5
MQIVNPFDLPAIFLAFTNVLVPGGWFDVTFSHLTPSKERCTIRKSRFFQCHDDLVPVIVLELAGLLVRALFEIDLPVPPALRRSEYRLLKQAECDSLASERPCRSTCRKKGKHQ